MTDSPAEKSLFSLAQIQHLMRVEFSRAQRYGYPISCLMIAVDRLGHLRDMYGYDSKEEIVDAVVDLLKGETRGSDFLGRMADDRLLAVVPHTDAAGLAAMCGRLQRAADGLGFENEGRRIPISISIGGSCDASTDGGERAMFFDTLIQCAEEALAEASEEGGEKVVFLTPADLGR